MNILVTGNRGYIGTVLCEMLLQQGYTVIGYDTDYYRDCNLTKYNQSFRQITKDIRDVSLEDLKNVDAVVHLAALSNDPLGELDPILTQDINFKATLKLASYAKEMGVQRFVYASSQSIYGISNVADELEEEASLKNPVTAYAKTKWNAECELKKMNSSTFSIVCFRPATVFGVSPKLRCDVVFNNFVACAYTMGKIEIKSDGTPWRPVIHVRDVSQAFIAGLKAPVDLISGQSFNVGIEHGNFTVKELALAAKEVIPDVELIFTHEHVTDVRTYKVSFKKIFMQLGEFYKPEWNLEKGAHELFDFFSSIQFSKELFRGRKCTRLSQLNYLMSKNKINRELKWV